MLAGRLGLETARIPHADRHGLLHLDRGQLTVVDGCLRFKCAGGGQLECGEYTIPHQGISLLLLGPGSMISHDALRLLARHGTAMAAVGDDGVRCYTAPPIMPDSSALARRQVTLWSDTRRGRMLVARRMYARRLGIIMPHRDIAVLRGIEGSRVRSLYGQLASKYGVEWNGRHYDRADPSGTDEINQAINHAASAVEGAAAIAVTATATIPQLGFIHEDSGQAWVLDIADLFRDSVTLPCAFRAIDMVHKRRTEPIERIVRKLVGASMRREKVIPSMIDAIKGLLAEPESGVDRVTIDDALPSHSQKGDEGASAEENES
ncbi:MAG: type I-E CRISPR-associated endonuclease Cas1e [bacterium]